MSDLWLIYKLDVGVGLQVPDNWLRQLGHLAKSDQGNWFDFDPLIFVGKAGEVAPFIFVGEVGEVANFICEA